MGTDVTRNRETVGTPRELDKWAATIACIAVGAFWPIVGPLSTATLVPLALTPVWLHVAMRSQLRWMGWLSLLTVINGAALAIVMTTGFRSVSTSLAMAQGTLVLTVFVGSGTVLWARTVLGPGFVAALFGIGVLLGQLRIGLSSDNPWKYNLFIPVLLIVLGLAWARRSPKMEAAALVFLVMGSVLGDSRSAASIAALALVTIAWQYLRKRVPGRPGRLQVFLTIGFVGVTLYLLMQTFILEGYLGAATQERSQEQMRLTGSLLLGGRPEMGSTLALLQAAPWGYGMGVLPDGNDVWVAKDGMTALNYDPNNGYVERYMFGQGMEVHSGIGDLWIHFGFVGLAFGVLALAIIGNGLLTQLTTSTAPALVVALTVFSFWDALFSPFHVSSTRVLIVTLALCTASPIHGNISEKHLRNLRAS